MTKLKPIAVALMVAGASTLAIANEDSPPPPDFYVNGPVSLLVNDTDIDYSERKAYAGLEAAMTVMESYAHDWGCSGSFDVTVVADHEGEKMVGNVYDNDDFDNFVMLDNLVLYMDLQQENSRGQMVKVTQKSAQTVGGKLVGAYAADFTFNADNNLMDGTWHTFIFGRNGPDFMSGYVIKDFYLGEDDPATTRVNEGDILYDWGLQSVRKLNKPVEKWWQRSKSRRSNTWDGKTVFQKDRLVGTTACRIVIETEGYNGGDWFEQEGTATLQRVTPLADIPELDSVQNTGTPPILPVLP